MSIWIQFSICSIVILFAGSKLSLYGDLIAERTGIGKNWIGLVLLATVTSLPELITGVSAVTIHDLPDMAVSGTIGSCMFNMVLIGFLDFWSKGRPISYVVHQGHILSAGFGIVLMGFVAIDILFGKHLPILTSLNSIDPLSLAFLVVYLIAMKLIFSYEQKHQIADPTIAPDNSEQRSLIFCLIAFSVNALIIVCAATYLPEIGEQIGKMTGWGQSFIGSSFIAIATSLPELAVSISAARRGSFDMAVASLLGSNLFNIAILAIIDFCYLKEPILRVVSVSNTLTALTAMISMAIVVIGLTYKSEKKYALMAGDAVALLLVYVLANCLLFVAH